MSETGTAVPAPRSGGSTADVHPVETAWADYVAAARQLDGVRRSAATAAGEQARSVAAAREELTAVRERLAAQQSRLRERSVSAISLAPTPPEVGEAARSMTAGPAAVLTCLRTAGGWVDAADDTLAARGLPRLARWPARPRNLLVYGPLALVVPLVQLTLFLTTGTGPASVTALVVGLPMPAVAVMVGWLVVGRLFRPRPEDRVDRTPRFGALVCLVPAVLSTAGILLAMLAG
ncbi:hypothetical protein ABZ671_05615 [Micromonospora sp. NPDC006766]|uniref:hypothetical protein n=1 Tax=Micromonospora sp. NPDC006766 TaxID=3154778 RepID=UPI0033DC3C59